MVTTRTLNNPSKGIIQNYSFQIGEKILSTQCPRLHKYIKGEYEDEATPDEGEYDNAKWCWVPYAEYRLTNTWHYYTIYEDD